MIREAITHIAASATLSESEAAVVMEEIMTGSATQAQMGAFLTALRLRPGGETDAEIAGMARVMREKAVQVHLDERIAVHAIDTCGTGGVGAGTFHVSTRASSQAADGSLLRKMGEVLLHLGCQHALVIHGEDGIDECSLSAPTRMCEVRKGEALREYSVTPEEVGLTRVTDRQLFQGGDPTYNAHML